MRTVQNMLLGALALGFLGAATVGSEAVPVVPLQHTAAQVQEVALV